MSGLSLGSDAQTNLTVLRWRLTLSSCYTACFTPTQLPGGTMKSIWRWKQGRPGSWLLSCKAQIFHLSIPSWAQEKQASKHTTTKPVTSLLEPMISFTPPQPPPFPFPLIPRGWEEQKKAAGFWTIKRKTESRNLAGNTKRKKHTECKLEQDKGRKNIDKASAWWVLTFFI